MESQLLIKLKLVVFSLLLNIRLIVIVQSKKELFLYFSSNGYDQKMDLYLLSNVKDFD